MANAFTYRTIILAKELPVREVRKDSDTVYYNYYDRYLPLDYAEEKNIDASSKIVSQPMQSGDVVSDHMYREPISINLTGYFALNGRNWDNDTYSNISKTTDRLTSIEEVFEYIKNNGILCDIMTIATEITSSDKIYYDEEGNLKDASIVPSSTRFLKRSNMALEKISWVEGLNDLKFTFNFKEVIAVKLDRYEVDYADVNGPAVNFPPPASLATIMVQNGQLDEIILSVLYEKEYLKSDFVGWLWDFGTVFVNALMATGIAVACGLIAVGAAVAAGALATGGVVASAIGGAISSVVPVGTIVVAAAIAIAAITWCIFNVINWFNNKEKEKKAFKLVNGSGKESEERLTDLINAVARKINEINSNLICYNFTTDLDEEKNKSTSVWISLEDGDYEIEVELINGNTFKANVKNANGEAVYMNNPWLPCADLSELNYNTIWFKPNRTSDIRVYLVNPSLSNLVNKTQEEIDTIKKKLTGYSIWISKGKPEDNVKTMTDAIFDAIHDYGFD